MRKVLSAVAALVAMAGAAQAQGAATQNVTLNATVNGYCSINGAATTSQTASVATANGKAGSQTLTLDSTGNVACTSNATVTLTTQQGGLSNPATVTGNFVNKIYYVATATYGGASVTLDSASETSKTSSLSTGGAQANGTLGLSVAITPTAATKTLVDGSYQDVLIVTLNPGT
jgi:hypothetical protein